MKSKILFILLIMFVLLLVSCSSDIEILNDTTILTIATTEAPPTVFTQNIVPTTTPRPILEKQSLVNKETGRTEYMKDYLGYIYEHKKAWDEHIDIPVYHEEELLYDIDRGFCLGYDAGRSMFKNTNSCMFPVVMSSFPSKAIRESKDQSYIYAVFDTDNGTRLFLFYSADEEKMHYRALDGLPVVMKESLQYGDFSKLEIGDSIERVAEVDPVIPLYYKIFDDITHHLIKLEKEYGIYQSSIHILTDGVLRIDYDKENEDSGFVITDIVYSEDYTLDGVMGNTSYRINSDDYVNTESN